MVYCRQDKRPIMPKYTPVELAQFAVDAVTRMKKRINAKATFSVWFVGR